MRTRQGDKETGRLGEGGLFSQSPCLLVFPAAQPHEPMKPPLHFHSVLAIAETIDRIPDPKSAQGFLTGAILANLAGHISEARWQAMLAVADQPCGREGCQCHVGSAALFKALDTQRKEFQFMCGPEPTGFD